MSDADMEQTLRALLADKVAASGVPSLAAAVVQGGQVVFEGAVGWADRIRRQPAVPHTVYALASISKPMTAVGLMRLIEQGLVDPDAPANAYLGAGKLTARVGRSDDITVARLVAHTAGLGAHHQQFYADQGETAPDPDLTIARFGQAVLAPGERFLYSNLGYGALGRIVERVARQPFDAYMREQVFLPLGMTRASYAPMAGLDDETAALYGADGQAYPPFQFDLPGGSSARSSVHDLALFARFLLGGAPEGGAPLLAPESLERLFLPPADGHLGSGYSWGWRVVDDQYGYRCRFHNGNMPCAATTLSLYPDQDLAVAVVCNTFDRAVFEVCHDVAGLFLPGYSARRTARLEQRRQRLPASAEPTPAPCPPLLVGTWEGCVEMSDGTGALWLDLRPDGLALARVGQGRWSLINDIVWGDGPALQGAFYGRLPDLGGPRRPYDLQLDVKLRDGELAGALVAVPPPELGEGGAPGRRFGDSIVYWCQLRRSAAL